MQLQNIRCVMYWVYEIGIVLIRIIFDGIFTGMNHLNITTSFV